jgi:hypothetical protein
MHCVVMNAVGSHFDKALSNYLLPTPEKHSVSLALVGHGDRTQSRPLFTSFAPTHQGLRQYVQ